MLNMTKNDNFVIFCIKLSFLIFTAHFWKKPPIEIDQIRFFLILALYSIKKIRTRRLSNFLSFQPLPEQSALYPPGIGYRYIGKPILLGDNEGFASLSRPWIIWRHTSSSGPIGVQDWLVIIVLSPSLLYNIGAYLSSDTWILTSPAARNNIYHVSLDK